MQTQNPVTEERSEYNETSLSDIPTKFDAAAAALVSWSQTSIAERVTFLNSLVAVLKQNESTLAQLITSEMGKPIVRSRMEVTRAIEEILYLVRHGEEFLTPETVSDHTAARAQVRFDALGVVGVISPWNFPIMLPLRSLVPALFAGNAVLFKPSELTPRCGTGLAKLVQEALREHSESLQLIIGGKEHGQALMAQPIALVSFTGSTVVGKQIAADASKRLTRVLLELGGLDAAIVLADVDVDKTAKALVASNAANAGQVCNALKRVYVHQSIEQPLLEALTKYSQELRSGDPGDESTTLGPIVSAKQLERVERFVVDAVKKGATVCSGGQRVDRPGFYYKHTVLSDVNDSMDLLHEEPFGPVLPVIPIQNWEEGVRAANSTRYGLTGSVWTQDVALAEKIATLLDVGLVSINAHSAGGPGTPWGGAKESGIGRMKTKEGLREFTNVKLVRWSK